MRRYSCPLFPLNIWCGLRVGQYHDTNSRLQNLTSKKLLPTAIILTLAGSETTSTLLAGVTYLLLKNPESLAKVKEEVRSAFGSEEEITLISVQKLNYMLDCLTEALRFYPPVPVGMPRSIPKGGATVDGFFIPEDVSYDCHLVSPCFHQMDVASRWEANTLLRRQDDGISVSICSWPAVQILDRPGELPAGTD
jgi:cytochrome P450